jgi:hypothetical protein
MTEPLYQAVRTHLSSVRGLPSLRLQNHLYGCYLLLEDIVQKNVTLSGTIVQSQHVTFDLSKQFAEIGLRYGFAMDTQLLLTPCPSDYQEAWVHVFTTLTSLEEVDALEEALNEIIQQAIPAEEGFFVSTAETGTLPPKWVDRALSLLLPTGSPEPAVEPKKEDPVKPTNVVTSASLLEKHKDNPKRMFASTRRKKLLLLPPKRTLATTRRSTKSTV